MSDPRVEAAAVAYYVTDGWSQDDSATPDAGWTGLEEYARADYRALTGIILAAADAADRDLGVVRVDLRDEDDRREITYARMRYYGYTDEQIGEAESTTHQSAGCEREGYDWICDQDGDGKSNHPAMDELSDAAEWVCWLLDELDARRAVLAALAPEVTP